MIKTLGKLFRIFLTLGTVSFGGYMALISMMRDRLVKQEALIKDDVVAEGISLASILPGPVAVNVVAFTGFQLAGVLGSLTAVIAVLLPSFILVMALTIFYFEFNTSMMVNSILSGIIPVVAAIIISVGYSMAKSNLKTPSHVAALFISIAVGFFFPGNISIILILIGGGLIGAFFFRPNEAQYASNRENGRAVLLLFLIAGVLFVLIKYLIGKNIYVDIITHFSTVSVTLFGGGYVMIPVLQSLMVDKLHWVSQQEFIYAISIGQVTPGPILISAAFFGYKVSGISGALVATIAIFLPSALLMVLVSHVYSFLRSNPYVNGALSLIKPAIAGLILLSAFVLLNTELFYKNWIVTSLIGIISLILIFWLKFKPVFLIIGGALIGYLFL